MSADLRRVKGLIAWLLLAASLFFLLTGFGISDWKDVGALTFGLLGRAESSRLHEIMWIPFVALLALHVALNVVFRGRPGKKD